VVQHEPAPLSAPTPPDDDHAGVVREHPRFPIVGIGASAGGLEALEVFLRNVPEGSGMAFVVIQHLDPTRKNILADLLQRSTAMPVVQVTDRLQIQPGHVYVTPPNHDMSLLQGTLHLLPIASPRGLNLPIDFFFRALAEDHAERSVGVILSGMGSDGTLGLGAIKEKGGATFVQAPGSAKYDSMPRSAMTAGLADVVAPVDELPSRILAFIEHTPYHGKAALNDEQTHGVLDKVFVLLRTKTGNDFSLYKRSTILRRIERRMGLHQITSLASYVRFLRENPDEIDLLFKELLIGVTCFFRDPAEWEHLKQDVVPALLSMRSGAGAIRVWVAGCSTGEEAYSLAIVCTEALEPFRGMKNIALQVFATDLDRDAIERARAGLYPENITADVSAERLRRFFVREDGGYRISKSVRENIVFAPQNLVMDPPFTKMDIVVCRNVLIYLAGGAQKKVIPLFHYCLNPDGVLFLGSAETIGAFSGIFAPLNGKVRIYRRLESVEAALPNELRVASFDRPTVTLAQREPEHAASNKPITSNLQTLVERVLVQRFSPVGVLCNDKGDILYVSSRAGKYLEPAIGKASLNIFAMARAGLHYDLSSAFSAAVRSDRGVTARGIKVGTNGDAQYVDLTVQRLAEPKELAGTVIVVIADALPMREPAKASRTKAFREHHVPRLKELEHELQQTRDELQSTHEEMQASQEELKSINEELQSTNEELQSTNEELTTSKEEMQSLNEELQTVNHELQAKVDELSRSNNDMKNLLNSTDIATLFLDGDLRVRRFTTPTAKIIKLIPTDAGRPITDIASDLDYNDLAEDAREVLRTLVFQERQVATRGNRWFTVRIMPYRTLDNVIDGVVITFTDATAARAVEFALREQASQLRQMAEALPILVWGARPDGGFDYISRQWADYTGIPDVDQLHWAWLEQIHPEDRERVREAWRVAIRQATTLEIEARLRSAAGAYRWFKTRGSPIRDAQGTVLKWYGTSTDVDDLKMAEQVQRARDEVAELQDMVSDGFVTLDKDLTVTAVSPKAERMLDRSARDVLGKPLLGALLGARGSLLEHRISEARRGNIPLALEIGLDGDQVPRPYTVWIVPQNQRQSVLLVLEALEATHSGDGVADEAAT
jgi:two-component system CheB/CheR fusion protein